MRTEIIEYNDQIINTLISQLGGNRFFFMTGSKPMHKSVNCENPQISLKLARNGSKANYLIITYISGLDLYRMEFIRMTKSIREVVKVYNEVYCDQLQQFFTQETGLYTKL